MKNTVQRYGLLANLQEKFHKNFNSAIYLTFLKLFLTVIESIDIRPIAAPRPPIKCENRCQSMILGNFNLKNKVFGPQNSHFGEKKRFFYLFYLKIKNIHLYLH